MSPKPGAFLNRSTIVGSAVLLYDVEGVMVSGGCYGSLGYNRPCPHHHQTLTVMYGGRAASVSLHWTSFITWSTPHTMVFYYRDPLIHKSSQTQARAHTLFAFSLAHAVSWSLALLPNRRRVYGCTSVRVYDSRDHRPTSKMHKEVLQGYSGQSKI